MNKAICKNFVHETEDRKLSQNTDVKEVTAGWRITVKNIRRIRISGRWHS
jgi:hypothetical protein